MDRDTWNDLATFAAIVEAGSFTGAAARLGVSVSAVSHAVKGMETRLGLRLLNRTTRSVAPTEAGEQLLVSLRPAMADLGAALGAIESRRAHPAGRLRITLHRSAAFDVVLPKMARFTQDFPDIMLELVIDDGIVDIVENRFDAGIRRLPSLEQDMISVKLDDGVRLQIVASPVYLAAMGRPRVPDDLRQHRCLKYRFPSSGLLARWFFEKDGETTTLDLPGNFITNDIDVLLDGALTGVGIACVVATQAAPYLASGALISLLDDFCPLLPPNYLYYAGRRNISPALRVFIDALRDKPRRTEPPQPY